MIMQKKLFLSAISFLCFSVFAQAQSPVSGFMNGKGKGSVALSYASESYDNVLLVPVESAAVPVFNDVKLNAVSLYATYGISNKFDVVVSLPYITAEGNASAAVLKELNFENKRSGLQDVALSLKYNPLTLKLGENDLSFVVAAGFSTPVGSYKVDEGLQSILAIGNRATTVNGLGIAHFKTQSGIFITTQAGYSVRNGEVPNAVVGEIKAGYAGRRIYADAWFAGQTSNGGVNILGQGFAGFFPATNVSYNRAGITLYAPIAAGFGVSVAANKYLNGKNIGESTGFSGAVIYSF
jgi:hypothetical protein